MLLELHKQQNTIPSAAQNDQLQHQGYLGRYLPICKKSIILPDYQITYILTYTHQCYLGKKRLDKAIDYYKKTVPNGAADTFTLTWHPFYLDPSLPKTGIPLRERMLQKFGPERLDMVNQRMKQMGEQEGICFNFERKVGNTRDAHRLIQLAKTKSNEMENKVMAALFHLHFEEGGDVTSHDVLATAGERAGLDRAEVKSWLDKDSGGREVDAEVQEAYDMDVHGVPRFVINDEFEVNGAQEPTTFLGEFARAKAATT